MTESRLILSVAEVRVKLDNLIAHAERRADTLEQEAANEPESPFRAGLEVLAEHQFGRLHGLKEARELLDTLEC